MVISGSGRTRGGRSGRKCVTIDQVPRRGHSGQTTCQKNGAAKGAPSLAVEANPEAGLGAEYLWLVHHAHPPSPMITQIVAMTTTIVSTAGRGRDVLPDPAIRLVDALG